MDILTSKQIKMVSANLRKIHYEEMSNDSKDRFNNFQYQKWVNCSSLLDEINKARDGGNLEGVNGFSSALFLSKLIKVLSEAEKVR